MINLTKAEEKEPLWTKNFIMLCLSNLAMITSFYLLLPTLPKFASDVLGASKGQIGFILGIYSLAAVLIRPFAGYLLDSVDRRMVNLLSLAGFALVMLSYNLITSLALLFLVRFLHGFTFGLANTSGPTIAGDILPPSRRGEGVGYFGLSWALAMAIGPIVGLALIADNSYDRLFIGSAIIAGMALMLATPIRLPKLALVKRPMSWNSFFENKVMPLSMVMFFPSIGFGAVVSFITLYSDEIGVQNGSLFFVIYAVALTVARPISGRMFDREGPKKLFTAGLMLLIIGFIVLSQWGSASGIVVSAILIGLGNGASQPTMQAMVLEMVPPERRGIAISTIFSAVDIGIGVGSIVMGWLADFTSLSTMYLVSGLIIMLPLIYFYSFVSTHYQNLIKDGPKNVQLLG